MEQWYKDGVAFNSDQSIRNYFKESSLPHFMSDSIKLDLGLVKVVDVVPTILPTQRVVEGTVEFVNGIPTKMYTVVDKTAEELSIEQSEYMAQLVQKFTDITTQYIEGKVSDYNKLHGLAFKDIDAFAKYAINPLSIHHVIANKFINYADAVWSAARNYQATATVIPTEVEFKAVLDGVVF